MVLLLTRPRISCGTCACISVVAAIIMSDAPTPIPRHPANATRSRGNRAIDPFEMPHSRIPAVTRCAFCWTRRASGVTANPPNSMPAPITDPRVPNRYEFECSTSRTKTAVSEPKALMAKVPAAMERITKLITGCPRMKRVPENRSLSTESTCRLTWAGRGGMVMAAIINPEKMKLPLSR